MPREQTGGSWFWPFIRTYTSYSELQAKKQQLVIKWNEIWTRQNKQNNKWQLNKVLPENQMKLFTYGHDTLQNDNNEETPYLVAIFNPFLTIPETHAPPGNELLQGNRKISVLSL